MSSRPQKIGITGGIGAGKSIVCEVFRALLVPVYNADSRAKWLMENAEEVKALIKGSFGEKAYNINGFLDRNYLARAVFPHEKNLTKINQIVHPAVERDFNAWVEQYLDAKYIMKEAALLVETASYLQLDALIVVSAPERLRIQRVLKRDTHRTKSDILRIISKQLDEQEKLKAAKYVIVNDDKKSLLPQILKIHDLLIKSV